MPKLGIYLHIPYCLHKCGYCDFNSHKINSGEMSDYVQALVREIRHYAPRFEGRKVQSVFFGGGTPTTLPTEDLSDILNTLWEFFQTDSNCEITVEANPATLEATYLRNLRAAGFNRISIGVQSFQKAELALLERVHSSEEADRTIDQAKKAGFDNLSMDLMFALPGQTLSNWRDTLQKALGKNPEHLSAYNLTIEPDTAFYKHRERGLLCMPPEDFQLELYKETLATLTDAGYEQYEISNFAKPGRECRHNINYWENGEYLGLGAGASSYIAGERFKNTALPSRYIAEIVDSGQAVEFSERLNPAGAMGETLMLGLRMLQGLDIARFEKRFQVSFIKTYEKILDALLIKNLVALEDNRLALTNRGLFLADSVILEFLP